MSDSESENEYESADEDTEDSISKSEDPLATNLPSAFKTELDSTQPTQKDSSNKIAPETIQKADSNLKKNIESEINSDCQQISNDNECKKQSSCDSKTDKNPEPDLAETLSKPPEIEPVLPIKAEHAVETDGQVKPVRVEQAADSVKSTVISSPPKRVTLRLERKLQERNQQASSPNDSKPPVPKVEEQTTLSWGFGSWGSSLLSTAASSVTTFTSQVSQGIGTVLETVETTLGAPPPEDLAAILKERRETELLEEKDTKDQEEHLETVPDEDEVELPNENDEPTVPGTNMLFTGVSSLTKVVGNTGSKVLMGGLDTLEMIGKKTFDILTEGDPNLRKKRSAFSDGISLSQMLREAKEKAEENQANSSFEDQEEAVYYSSLFDEYQGLVHLEALEMLSSQCQSKVQRMLLMMSGDSEEKHNIEQISEICENLPSVDETPDIEIEQDFEAAISDHLTALTLDINLEKIKSVREKINNWLNNCLAEQEKGERKDAKDIHRHAISSLAEFTAKCTEQFHKFGELIMIQNPSDFDAQICATRLTGLSSVLCTEVSILSTKYCQSLNIAADDSEDPDSVTPLITSVYLEASNSTTYIQDAFQLLVPVLQTSLLQ